MFLKTPAINETAIVTDIVRQDYRTADIFKKYGIDFCCGGKWPLKTACEMRGLEVEHVIQELENATRNVSVSNLLNYHDWDLDFLTDYIINIHHRYLDKALPLLKEQLEKFIEGHGDKFLYLEELQAIFLRLYKEIMPHLRQEEDIIFPYIRQIAHAYKSDESYAGLLVRTLRKPIETVMQHEHETMDKVLSKMRELTGYYTAPSNACISHKVVFSKLKEMDEDLVQHIHLENDILFPRAIAMENELLHK
ncbi:MAG TPA: iron-sulfur cluster repair di-iron protein [Chitinophagaceae bacterium]|jgi:regulator of cell morphogenesis and NO signaling|nr:iron-sulfur cluster repair di-iron protein [Chitinophagaceae bacterium]